MTKITRVFCASTALFVSVACSSSPERIFSPQPAVTSAVLTACAPLPPGVKLYGGLSVADVEKAGRFPMQHPEHHDLATDSPIWLRFRAELLPTDLVYEYYHDERWEGGGMYHGGLAAFRDKCTVKIEQAWTT